MTCRKQVKQNTGTTAAGIPSSLRVVPCPIFRFCFWLPACRGGCALHVSRPRGRIRLHRPNGAVWRIGNRHAPHGSCPQHPGIGIHVVSLPLGRFVSLARILAFALGAIPFGYVGGSIQLPGAYYRPLVGAILLLSGARLLSLRELKSNLEPRDSPIWAGMLCGVGTGFCPASLAQVAKSSFRHCSCL